MATLDDAVKAVVDAVDALEAARQAEVPPVAEPDAVRTAVENVLTSEGWTKPEPPAEDVSEPTPEAVTETAEAA